MQKPEIVKSKRFASNAEGGKGKNTDIRFGQTGGVHMPYRCEAVVQINGF
jgi:hypothetical protein